MRSKYHRTLDITRMVKYAQNRDPIVIDEGEKHAPHHPSLLDPKAARPLVLIAAISATLTFPACTSSNP